MHARTISLFMLLETMRAPSFTNLLYRLQVLAYIMTRCMSAQPTFIFRTECIDKHSSAATKYKSIIKLTSRHQCLSVRRSVAFARDGTKRLGAFACMCDFCLSSRYCLPIQAMHAFRACITPSQEHTYCQHNKL